MKGEERPNRVAVPKKRGTPARGCRCRRVGQINVLGTRNQKREKCFRILGGRGKKRSFNNNKKRKMGIRRKMRKKRKIGPRSVAAIKKGGGRISSLQVFIY